MHTIPYQTSPKFYKFHLDGESLLKRGWTLADIAKYLDKTDIKLLMMPKNDPTILLKIYDLKKIEKIETMFNFLSKKNESLVNSNIEKMKDTVAHLKEDALIEDSNKYYSENYVLNNLKVHSKVLTDYFKPDKLCINPLNIHGEPVKLYLKFKIDNYVKDRAVQKCSTNSLLYSKKHPVKNQYCTKTKALKKLKRLRIFEEKFDNLFKPDKKHENEKGLIINLYDVNKINKYLMYKKKKY